MLYAVKMLFVKLKNMKMESFRKISACIAKRLK